MPAPARTGGRCGWPRVIGRHRATVWKVLKRHGVSRRRRGTRQTFKRFEWSQPGALLHIDAYKAPKFLARPAIASSDKSYAGRTRAFGPRPS